MQGKTGHEAEDAHGVDGGDGAVAVGFAATGAVRGDGEAGYLAEDAEGVARRKDAVAVGVPRRKG